MENFPVDIGLVYEGERIRGKQMQVELGGPKNTEKFELVQARKMNEVKDGQIKVIGPDLKDMEIGKSYSIGILVEVAGAKVEKDLEAVLERRIHEFSNFVEGMMHLNQRYDIWMRLSKQSFKKGFNTLKWLGQALIHLFRSSFEKVIEKIQVTIITDPKEIKPWYDKAIDIYKERDERTRTISDDDVDEFYGCVLCSSFAPAHVCTITPGRIALCGSISWFDARAAAKVDPKGPNFLIEKGELLDPLKGEYSGINEAAKKKSLGEIERVHLHTILSPYNHTSCGCFEGIAYFIPEVDGIGIVDRNFKGTTVNGLPFSTMANSTGGGKQVEGFVGIGKPYMLSDKFFQADGGWDRVVWISKAWKDYAIEKNAIPAKNVDMIATEADATDLDSLKDFLRSKNHPVVKNWVEEEEEDEDEVVTPAMVPTGVQMPMGVPMAPAATGGWKIILKGARITAEELIIKRIEPKKKKK
ncbi:MAG: CO dehydrogenase/CO-methylating acetyl-CoA synthase complex subunit beta [Candidatus Helarchaeota archaeon]|nr:CO dehydrogenase/CO-methylating acetyl-CoA synthase complex subunit beta [Candidatus Helarchaeota archaeon]